MRRAGRTALRINTSSRYAPKVEARAISMTSYGFTVVAPSAEDRQPAQTELLRAVLQVDPRIVRHELPPGGRLFEQLIHSPAARNGFERCGVDVPPDPKGQGRVFTAEIDRRDWEPPLSLQRRHMGHDSRAGPHALEPDRRGDDDGNTHRQARQQRWRETDDGNIPVPASGGEREVESARRGLRRAGGLWQHGRGRVAVFQNMAEGTGHHLRPFLWW